MGEKIADLADARPQVCNGKVTRLTKSLDTKAQIDISLGSQFLTYPSLVIDTVESGGLFQ